MTGSINDVDSIFVTVPLPETSRGGGGDSDSALLFLFHPVHRGSAFVDFTDLVRDACIKQYALGSRRLTGVNVRHNPNVAEPI